MALQVGQRVQLTREGQQLYPYSPLTGTIQAVSMRGAYLTVLPDGRKTAERYAAWYWEPLPWIEPTVTPID